MKRIITLIIACCLLFGLCACGSSSSEKEAHPGESVVKKAANAICDLDVEKAVSCTPPAVRQYFRASMQYDPSDYDDFSDIKAKVKYARELSDDEIQSLIAEYEHEAGGHLDIDEAHLYECIVTYVDAEDGDSFSSDYEMVSVKIDGKWYALDRHI